MQVFQPGSILDQYTLQMPLRADASRCVWVAREAFTNRLVNIHICTEPDDFQRARFQRAMSILSRLDHPAIARLVGSGYIAGNPYLATEHIDGPTLEELAAQGGRMHELHVLRIARQIADGFDQAWNRAQVIHRDLKPASILVDLLAMRSASGAISIKVTDFGHALGQRLVDQFEDDLADEEADFQRVTRSERVGTAVCMSPEQVLGKELGPGSDMYALGVTMFLLLAGHPPFTGDEAEVRNHHLHTPAPDLPADVSSGTRSLLRRLLGKLPDMRYDSWAHLRTQIDSLIRHLEPKSSRQETDDGSGTRIRYRRKTESFERTPAGQAVTNERFAMHSPPSQTSMDTVVQMLNRLALASSALPPALPPASAPAPAPAPAPAAIATTPTAAPTPVGDRSQPQAVTLSPDQLNTLWSYLFSRNGTPPQHATAPPAGSPAIDQALAHQPTSIPPSHGMFATTALQPRPAEPAQSRPTQAIQRTKTQPVTKPIPAPVAPWSVRDAVVEALAVPLLHGTPVKTPSKAHSITSRVTHRIKRMLGDRKSFQFAIERALRIGDVDEASRLIDDLAGTKGNDGPLCLLRARLDGQRGAYERMIDWAQRAIAQHVGDPTALAIIAMGCMGLCQDQLAETAGHDLARESPETPLGPLCLAGIALIAGKTDAAAQHLTEAEQLDPEHPALVLITAAWWRDAQDAASEAKTLQLYRDLYGDIPVVTARLEALGCA